MNDIKERLLKIFPNKKLDDFTNKIKPLKKEITLIKPKGLSLKKYVELLGFDGSKKNILDKNIIEILEGFTDINNYERKYFEECLGVSKQSVSDNISKVRKSTNWETWTDISFSKEENLLIEEMIKEKKHKIEKNGWEINIFFDKEVCIVVSFEKTNKKFKAISNQDLDIIKKLKMEGFHKYFFEDFKNIEYCKKIEKNGKVQVLSENLEESPNKKEKTVKLYIEFNSFFYIAPQAPTSDEIKKRIKKYLYYDSEYIVYIPTDSPDAYYLRRLASKEHKEITKFIESYGFEYYSEDTILRIKIIFKEISFQTNKIWFPSNNHIYRTLYNASKERNMSIDEMVKTLGFEKIKNKPSHIKKIIRNMVNI